MANLFVLNLDGTIAPVAADKNCNALITRAIAVLAGDSDVPSAPEPIDVDARRAALFGEVTAGAMSMDEAVAALKALDAEVVAAAKAAKADPPVLLLAGTLRPLPRSSARSVGRTTAPASRLLRSTTSASARSPCSGSEPGRWRGAVRSRPAARAA